MEILTYEQYLSVREARDIYWNEHPMNHHKDSVKGIHRLHRLELVSKLPGIPDGHSPKNTLCRGGGTFSLFYTQPEGCERWGWKILRKTIGDKIHFFSHTSFLNGNGYDDHEVFWQEEDSWWSGMAIGAWSSSIRRYRGSFDRGGMGAIAQIK